MPAIIGGLCPEEGILKESFKEKKEEIKHAFDLEKKKENKNLTKNRKFQDLPFFFYKPPPLYLPY